MDAKVFKASLLNSYADTDIATDTSVNPNLIRIPGLFPMAVNGISSVTAESAVTETQGVWTLDGTGSVTITASTKYQIKFGNTGVIEQGYTAPFKPYGYKAPAVLTSAATDRYNAYSALATQINDDVDAFATAYPIVTVPYDNQTGNFAVGETVTGTAGATGIVISDVDAGATGVLTIGMTGDYGTLFINNDVLTGSVAGVADASANATVGLGLRIVDDAGYYTPNTRRVGPNAAMATKGFASTQMVNTTAGVVSRGQGSFLLLDVPVQELLSDNLRSGTWEMATNNAPTAGVAYTKVTLMDYPNAFDGGLSNNTTQPQRIQVLYLSESDGSLANTLTALDNLNP